MITYPNAEHRRENEAAKRRAQKALETLISEANRLHYDISQDRHRDADDAQIITDATRQVTANLAILGALHDVREWAAADAKEGQ